MMDGNQFDNLARAITGSRRALLSGALVAAAGWLGVGDAAAKKKRKRKKRKPKARPNAFGCLEVGAACTSAAHCCSNICQGKKGKKHCKAHDTGECLAGQLLGQCGGETIPCTSSSGAPGRCEITTGNAAYCAGGGDCRPCAKDADCQALCGPQAACIQCPVGCAGGTGTQCVGPDNVVCPL
jgi:hypothetical protein